MLSLHGLSDGSQHFSCYSLFSRTRMSSSLAGLKAAMRQCARDRIAALTVTEKSEQSAVVAAKVSVLCPLSSISLMRIENNATVRPRIDSSTYPWLNSLAYYLVVYMLRGLYSISKHAGFLYIDCNIAR